ncbi:permease [Paenibacillus paeoniae]|uniref:Permease n=1 Tax=Paenibacillus paeoniae TaxID=2292705 RepID=A0A371PGA2_9BACL|nr:permease [Paenibacillus paeoniae]REK74626.1 permease [Paenibacillus paeoniae]
MQWIYRIGTPALSFGCLLMLFLIAMDRNWPSVFPAILQSVSLHSFKTAFIGVLLEAIPFVLLGVLFSALLQVFVSDELIRRFMPKRPITGVLFGALLGIVFPLCECGMIPVIRRLIRKGMPAYIGIVYLLAGPIINPIVFSSTYVAFRAEPQMAFMRMALAFGVASVIGLFFAKWMKGSPLKAVGGFHMISPQPVHSGITGKSGGFTGRAGSIARHASDEFFEMGKYLIIGAFLTAAIQASISRDALAEFADQPLVAYLFMMLFAYILSICSTSDAFIAASFSGTFQQGPLLAFLVFGPMIDFKNTWMMLSTFKLRIVLILIGLTSILTLAGALLAEVWL